MAFSTNLAYQRLFEYSDLISDGFWPQTVKYTQYYASYVAPLHELTPGDTKVNEILSPDSYVASQKFRDTLELERSLGAEDVNLFETRFGVG